jgi:outer membrane protein assembly factor BamA
MYRFQGYILSIIFLLFVSMAANAQVKDTTFVGAQIIEQQPVESDFIVGEIRIIGNKRTKPQMLYRELLFAKGDTIRADEWMQIRKQSAENLFNTSLFNSVGIKVKSSQTQIRDIEISVVERWYIWPIPVFEIDERNFNTWWQTKDLSRASAGVFLTHNNFRGRREVLKVLLMAGYNQKLGFSYTAPYVNKKKTIGLGFQAIYTLRHEVNYKTEYDVQQYLKLTDEPIQRDLLASTHITYRPNYFFTAFLQLRYRQYEFADSLLKVNSNYAPATDGRLQYMTIYGKFKYDRRDYKSYPLAGYYADLEIRNRGLGIFDNDMDIWSVQTTMRKYWTLSQRWYYAASFTGKLGGSAGTGVQQPYLFNRALGYGRDYVRTYQYYVVDGRSFGLLKMNLKFALIPPRKVKLNFIKTDKFNTIPYAFYLNAFFDAGYVDEPGETLTNKLPNRFIYGSGLGLDFVTYYDAVARFEFGVNHMGEMGFFLSFIAPI